MRLFLWLAGKNPSVGKDIRRLMRQEKRLPLMEGIFDLPDGTTLVTGVVEHRANLPHLGQSSYVIVDGEYIFYCLERFELLNSYLGKHVAVVLRNRKPTVEGGPEVAEA